MPTVQRYTRRVAPEQAPQPNLPADAFGAKFGEEIQRFSAAAGEAGRSVIDALQVMNKRVATAKARDVYNEARNEAREFMGVQFTKIGKEGVSVYPETEAYFQDAEKEWLGRLDNAYEQELFKKSFEPLMHGHLDDAMDHQIKQVDLYDKATLGALIEANIDDVTHNPWNGDDLELALRESEAAVAQMHQGRDRQVIEEEQSKVRADILAAAIKSQAVQDAGKAQKTFDAYGDRIKGRVHIELAEMLKNASVTQRSQVMADNIRAEYPDDYAKQYEAARRLSDNDETSATVRDAVLARLKMRKQEDDDLAASARETLTRQKYAEIQDQASLEDALDVADGVEDGKVRNELRRLARNEFGAKKIPDNPAAFNQGLREVDDGAVADMDRLESRYRGKVSDDEYGKLVERMRQGGAAGLLKMSMVESAMGMFTTLKKSSAEYDRQLKYVWDYVRTNLPSGQDPTDDTVSQLVSQAMIKGRVSRDWALDEKLTFGEAWRQRRLDEFTADVPGDMRDAVARQLRREGLPVTDQSVRDFYLYRIMGIPSPPQAAANRPALETPDKSASEMTDDELDAMLIDMGAPVEQRNRDALRRNISKEQNAANK